MIPRFTRPRRSAASREIVEVHVLIFTHNPAHPLSNVTYVTVKGLRQWPLSLPRAQNFPFA